MEPSPQISYAKLPGTGYRSTLAAWQMLLLFLLIGFFVLFLRGRRVQLWLGPDHLLVVESDGYRELYKRLAYSDVQWITIVKTTEGTLTTWISATLSFLLGLPVFLSSEPAVRVLFGILAGCVLLVFLYSFLAGPTCRVYLGTAVQREELVSLRHVKTAQKALTRLRPLVEQAQGSSGPAAPGTRDAEASLGPDQPQNFQP